MSFYKFIFISMILAGGITLMYLEEKPKAKLHDKVIVLGSNCRGEVTDIKLRMLQDMDPLYTVETSDCYLHLSESDHSVTVYIRSGFFDIRQDQLTLIDTN